MLGKDIFYDCMTWVNSSELPTNLNDTNLDLIPKCEKPDNIKDLKHISLYNALYKNFAKALANRLKVVLPNIISEYQSAFVPGRFIIDNFLATFEVLYFMKRKTKGKKGFSTLKIDINKAYDKVD